MHCARRWALGVLFSGGSRGVLLGDFWGPGAERLPRGGTIISVFGGHEHVLQDSSQTPRQSQTKLQDDARSQQTLPSSFQTLQTPTERLFRRSIIRHTKRLRDLHLTRPQADPSHGPTNPLRHRTLSIHSQDADRILSKTCKGPTKPVLDPDSGRTRHHPARASKTPKGTHDQMP